MNKKIILLIGLPLLLLSSIAAQSQTIQSIGNRPHALLENEKNTIAIFKRAAPFVVFVYRIQRIRSQYDTYYIPSRRGSGFILGRNGYVVTNFHVVRGAQTVAVSLRRGKAVRAKIVGVEPRKDIAVLKLINGKQLSKLNNLKPLNFADSNQLIVGQKAIAIGNPYGLDHSLTTGVISALGRRVRGIGGIGIYDMVQTDASINPGNSGGPLLDSQGQIIGMNTMIVSRSGQSAGIGFAVPSNTIKRIVNQIIKYGHVIQRGIGIRILDVRIASQLGVSGLIIGSVIPNSPAAKAGLRGTVRNQLGEVIFGDIIVAINNKRVRSYDDLYNILEKTKVGDEVELKYVRNRKVYTVKVRTINITPLSPP